MNGTARTIKPAYWIEDIVFLRVSAERKQGMVIGIMIRPGDTYVYEVQWDGGFENVHYEIELTKEFIASFE